MRKIEFNELRLKDMYDEEAFYQFYLDNLQEESSEKSSFSIPSKKYEIFYLNILGGKIILLNTSYIQSDDTTNQELYYDYTIAYQIYNYLLDIYDGIECEKNEINELYKGERLKIDSEISRLTQKDNTLFTKALEEYNIIKNSKIYDEYIRLQEENKKLKILNEELSKRVLISENSNISIIQKIVNKFKKIKRISHGENK